MPLPTKMRFSGHDSDCPGSGNGGFPLFVHKRLDRSGYRRVQGPTHHWTLMVVHHVLCALRNVRRPPGAEPGRPTARGLVLRTGKWSAHRPFHVIHGAVLARTVSTELRGKWVLLPFGGVPGDRGGMDGTGWLAQPSSGQLRERPLV